MKTGTEFKKWAEALVEAGSPEAAATVEDIVVAAAAEAKRDTKYNSQWLKIWKAVEATMESLDDGQLADLLCHTIREGGLRPLLEQRVVVIPGTMRFDGEFMPRAVVLNFATKDLLLRVEERLAA
jgi:hypothetical protein